MSDADGFFLRLVCSKVSTIEFLSHFLRFSAPIQAFAYLFAPKQLAGISKRSSLDDRFGVMRGSLFVMIVSGLLAINLVSLFLSVCLTGTGAWFQLRSVVSGFCREKVETQQQIC